MTGLVSVADELNHIMLAKETGNKMIAEMKLNDKGFWDEHFDRHGGFTGFWSRICQQSEDEKIVPENVEVTTYVLIMQP